MGTITVKYGSNIETRTGVSSKLIERKMEEILKRHPHICGSCSGEACKGKMDIENEYVVRGARTDRRQYVFDCLCCEYVMPRSYYSSNYDKVGQGNDSIYDNPVSVDTDVTFIDSAMDIEEVNLEEVAAFEDSYGDIIDEYDYDGPTYFKKKNRKKF